MSDGETRYKLTLHYDGAAFRGWQLQPGQPTVQGALEQAVRRLVGERRQVVGAGRTDTGVHARGQVAAVTVPASWEAGALVRSLNALLPESVWVQEAEAVRPAFNPRAEATSRQYEYRVGTVPESASPFHRRWCWPLCRALDVGTAGRAAARLPGERSFRAFAKTGQPHRGHLCRVFDARWRQWGDLGFVFHVSANRFLHRMVRYLVGTMVEIATGRRGEGDMERLLSEDPAVITSPPAPPQGLFLTRVGYSRGAARVAAAVLAAAVVSTAATACGPGDADAPVVHSSLLASAVGQVRDAEELDRGRSTAIVRAARTVAPAVVSISVRRRERVRRRSFFDDYFLPFRESQGLGSGFVVDPEGVVVTNHHVVENASEILVTLPDGRDFPARLAGSDPVTDVAVLLLDTDGSASTGASSAVLPTAPLGTAADLMIGEWTVAIGSPTRSRR